MSVIDGLIVTPQGEIDIVEGVNNKVPNQSTLHTSPSKSCNRRVDAPLLFPLRLFHAIIPTDDRVRLRVVSKPPAVPNLLPFQNERRT